MTKAVPTLQYLRSRTTVTIAEAAAWLGMSTATGYRAAADGSLQTLTVGKQRRVATPVLLAMVGLSYESGSSGAALPSNMTGAEDAGN
jgi:excisionase family DNA binding protein